MAERLLVCMRELDEIVKMPAFNRQQRQDVWPLKQSSQVNTHTHTHARTAAAVHMHCAAAADCMQMGAAASHFLIRLHACAPVAARPTCSVPGSAVVNSCHRQPAPRAKPLLDGGN